MQSNRGGSAKKGSGNGGGGRNNSSLGGKRNAQSRSRFADDYADDELMPPAFPIDDIDGPPDLSRPPETAEEYIQRVRWEARQCKPVVVVESIDQRNYDHRRTKQLPDAESFVVHQPEVSQPEQAEDEDGEQANDDDDEDDQSESEDQFDEDGEERIAPVGPTLPKKSSISNNSLPKLTLDQLRPTKEWIRSFEYHFVETRNFFARAQAKRAPKDDGFLTISPAALAASSGIEVQDQPPPLPTPVKLPPPHDLRALHSFFFSKPEASSSPAAASPSSSSSSPPLPSTETDMLHCRRPLLPLLFQFDHVTINRLIKQHIGWFLRSTNKLESARALWLYSLLVILEKPVDGDTAAAIRVMYKKCLQMRSALSNAQDESLPYLNMLLVIAGHVFNQRDPYADEI